MIAGSISIGEQVLVTWGHGDADLTWRGVLALFIIVPCIGAAIEFFRKEKSDG